MRKKISLMINYQCKRRLLGVSMMSLAGLSGCSLMVAKDEVLRDDAPSTNMSGQGMGGESSTGGSKASEGTGGQDASTGGQASGGGASTGGSEPATGGAGAGGSDPATGGSDPATGGSDPATGGAGTGGSTTVCNPVNLFRTDFLSRHEASAGSWTDSAVSYSEVDGSYRCVQKAAQCGAQVTLDDLPSSDSVQRFEVDVRLNRSVNQIGVRLSNMTTSDMEVTFRGDGTLSLSWGATLLTDSVPSFDAAATVVLSMEVDAVAKTVAASVVLSGTTLAGVSHQTGAIDYGNAPRVAFDLLHANVDEVPLINWGHIHEVCP